MSADWSKSSWEVEFNSLDSLVDKMKQLPDQSEKIINRVLHEKSAQKAVLSIIQGMPISEVKKRLTNKKHARLNQPMTINTMNLGFKVRPKKKYDYVKYPDLGIGTSIKNHPQEFMRKGMEKEVKVISDELMVALMEEIERKN